MSLRECIHVPLWQVQLCVLAAERAHFGVGPFGAERPLQELNDHYATLVLLTRRADPLRIGAYFCIEPA